MLTANGTTYCHRVNRYTSSTTMVASALLRGGSRETPSLPRLISGLVAPHTNATLTSQSACCTTDTLSISPAIRLSSERVRVCVCVCVDGDGSKRLLLVRLLLRASLSVHIPSKPMGQASSALVRGASTPGRASRGIYAGRQVLSGNSISFSDHRCVLSLSITHRSPRTNLRPSQYQASMAAQRAPQVLLQPSAAGVAAYSHHDTRVTVCRSMLSRVLSRAHSLTHATRCIEKSGGIDDYILYTKPKNLADSELALSLRTRLISAWEAQHQSTFDRRRIVYERLVAESAKQQALATATAGATTSTSTATEDDGSSAAVNHAA